MTITLRAPFQVEGGRVALVSDQRTKTEQKIVDVLVTNTLERTGAPDYGASLGAAVFENTDSLEFQDFKIDMVQRVSESVTGVSITDIRWEVVDTQVTIEVVYRLPLSSDNQFTFRLAIPGDVDEETPLS